MSGGFFLYSLLFASSEEAAHVDVASHASGPASHASAAMPEVGNLITLLNSWFEHNPIIHFLHQWENPFYSLVAASLILFVFSFAIRKRSLIPGRLQSFAEITIEWLDSIVFEIIGHRGREFTPFIATIFVFILVQNMFGIIPLMKAPTSSINTTFALALCVFLYVQFIGITKNGILGYFHHLAGSPQDAVGWLLSPLMFVLHVLGEFIKPISLSLRLFGNIMGEDTLIGVFAGLGIVLLSFMHSPVGVPLQFPIMLLSLLLGTIQALVFTLLSTIYIFLMLPHEEH